MKKYVVIGVSGGIAVYVLVILSANYPKDYEIKVVMTNMHKNLSNQSTLNH